MARPNLQAYGNEPTCLTVNLPSNRLDPLISAYWKAGCLFSYETQYRNYIERTKWKMPCTAGQTSVVIDYNGDVRVCEILKPIGNLRRYGMDFRRFWGSSERSL